MMDDLDPYSDNYTGYDTGYPGSYKADSGDTKQSSAEEIIQHPGIAASNDPRRFFEISVPEPAQSYFPKSKTSSNPVPLTAFFADAGRVSIHPLGITDTPAGVAEKGWTALDSEGLLLSVPEIDSLAIGGMPEAQKSAVGDEKAITETSAAGGAGGDGGSDDKADEEKPDSTEMPFLDHLEEFRWALLKSIFAVAIGMLVSWFLAEEFIKTITRLATGAELTLVYNKIMESIMIRLQTALFMGIVISLPFVFYFLWSFVSPGLYKKEKKWILPVLIGGTICFFIGASIAYFIIIPFMLQFLKGYMVQGVQDMISIGNFIGTMLKFTAVFGVIFEMPMVAFVLARIGILKHTLMSKYRKYAIIIIFVVGAILTPPDVLSQIMMAVPLVVLYEISIIVARIAGRKTLL